MRDTIELPCRLLTMEVVAGAGSRQAVVARAVSATMAQSRLELADESSRLSRQVLSTRGRTMVAYPLVGADGSNRVQYIAHRGRRGSFTSIRSCREWRQAVNAGHYRYVVTSASRNVWSHALGFSPEGDWTRSDPGARRVFPRETRAQTVVTYEILRPLDPARC